MEVRRDTEGMTFRSLDSQAERQRGWDERDRSVSDLVGDLTSHVAHLARVEARLAAREMGEKAKKSAAGGGMFAAAGVLALYGGAAFAGAALIALALVMPAWAAALIVGGALVAIAGIVALIGRSMLTRSMPPVPEEAVERAKEDLEAMSGRMEQ